MNKPNTTNSLFFRHALLPTGWTENVRLEYDAAGIIAHVTSKTPDTGAYDGHIAVPGMVNLHSHAFQRAMAGLGEWRGQGTPTQASASDSFWTWRQVMYRFLSRLTPQHLQHIASQLYIEMLQAGFTSVCEFHYVHHQVDGSPYNDIAEMSLQIMHAAEHTGIGLTLLPVFYAYGGFAGQGLSDAQLRFANDPDRFLKLTQRCKSAAQNNPHTVIGIAPHSLRAVTPETLTHVVDDHPNGPIHIHIAEQRKEVDDCVEWSGTTPVQWLHDNCDVNDRWCLIHATHMTSAETLRTATSGAVAGLCPITEANLGDGIFDGVNYIKHSGAYGVGSDSNIRIDLAEELRSLEYSQRLRDLARNRLVAPGMANGRSLFDAAVSGGATAAKQACGQLSQGNRCDVVCLDGQHPAITGRQGDDILNGWIFSGDRGCVKDVWVGGQQKIFSAQHPAQEDALKNFSNTLTDLSR